MAAPACVPPARGRQPSRTARDRDAPAHRAQIDQQRRGRPGVERDLEGLAQLRVELGVGPAGEERDQDRVGRGGDRQAARSGRGPGRARARDGGRAVRAVPSAGFQPASVAALELEPAVAAAAVSVPRPRPPVGRSEIGACATSHDRIGDPGDDQQEDQVVDVLEALAHGRPVAPERVPGEREREHPGDRAEEGEHGEAPERHPRDAGGQRDEGADQAGPSARRRRRAPRSARTSVRRGLSASVPCGACEP